MSFINDISNVIKNHCMIKHGGTVIVGCSGGADSIALLHCLNILSTKLNFNIKVAHINHMLRGEESDNDEKFVKDFCNKYNLELFIHKIDVAALAKKQSKNFEQFAREVRYNFFTELCENGDVVATAHTISDSLETSLFNLARGTGLNGFAGIKPVNYYYNIKIIRPLINKSRNDIELYCIDNNLDYVTDSTNADTKYSRNRIRANVIPQLLEINTRALTHYAHLSEQINLTNEYIDKQADIAMQAALVDTRLNIDVLKNLDEIILHHVIIKYAKQNDITLEYLHIKSIINAINQLGGKVNLLNNKYAYVNKNYLEFIYDKNEDLNQLIKLKLLNNEEIEFRQISDLIPSAKYGKIRLKINFFNKDLLLDKTFKQWAVDADCLQGECYIRTAIPSDRITLQHRGCTKTLKQIKKELQFSTHESQIFFVLCDDLGVFYMPLIGVDKRVVVNLSTTKYINIKFL